MQVRTRRGAFLVCTMAVTAAFGACVSTTFDDGQYTCTPGPGASCPEGLVCARDGRCRVHELPFEDGDIDRIDASSLDAASDGDGSCPTAKWRALFDARAPEGIEVRADGRVFAVGTAGKQGWVAELDPCSGAVLGERLVVADQQTETAFHALASKGDELIVVGGSKGGQDGGAVFHGRFGLDLTAAGVTDRTNFPTGEATRVAIGTDGTAWLTGPTPGAGFLARVGTTICTTTFVTTAGGVVPRPTGAADVLRDGNPAVLMFVDSKCAVSTETQSLFVGTGNVDVNGMVSARGGLVAIGTATATSPNTLFWIAETKDGDSLWKTATLDPNGFDRDVGRHLAYDGTSLFAAVSQRASTSSGTPTLYRYDGAITAASKPIWIATPFGPNLLEVRHVAVPTAPADGVFVVGLNGAGGGVARCTKAGECLP